MVPCLNQGNIYTKRKLRVWRDQKCIPLVGAKTPLTCAGRQTTLSRFMRYRAKTGKLSKLGGTYRHVTRFAPRQYLYQKEATGMGDQKYIPLVSAKTPLTCAGRQTTLSRFMWYRAKTGKLRKLGGTYRHDTRFTPRQYLYQKEATGMDRPEMYSASWCKNHTYLCETSN